ncbi:MAG: 50S ribosomal protein L11 methyltransferase [Bacteroidales bacterium]|nr:50S ribosomal protein L11 methyltransferase [Bacteroidales bacterium]MCB9000024.1 50S ribosomal protein L11 methyltransferase [Bacteroidales bacterium]MCB9013246.1 50S ribosomal protein L11 methyltransferase [Bacteroidales bacterium]
MNHLELSIDISGLNSDQTDLLLAFMSEAGFDSFHDDGKILKAFCKENSLGKSIPDIIKSFPFEDFRNLNYSTRIISEKNWNEQWEKDFPPIVVDDRILIKAPFHKVPDLEYTVIIEPKMSFGTGHHETTRLVLREMLRLDLKNKEVLDMGCGTGVLGIVAKMMGASYVLSLDIDEWAYNNTFENYQRNNIPQAYDILPGDASALEGHTFHVILANINRNIILADMHHYYKALKKGGIMVLSGILKSDEETILSRAKEFGLIFISSFYENNWISLNLRK